MGASFSSRQAISWGVLGVVAVAGACALGGSVQPALAWVWPGGLALAWMAAAWGVGSLVAPALLGARGTGAAPGMHAAPGTLVARGTLPARVPCSVQLAVGVAAGLAADSVLATVGAFSRDRPWMGSVVLAAGLACGAVAWWRARAAERAAGRAAERAAGRAAERATGSDDVFAMLWPWVALPALCAVALAAAVPPGLMWSTEFGGYDALSYHLEVPREWLAQGVAGPLPHNVYAAFPGFVESATLHLMSFGPADDPRWAGVAAQMLHALLTLATAWVTGSAASACMARCGYGGVARAAAQAGAWAFVLGVPWTLVVGTLAYNEMGMMLCLAGAMWVAVAQPAGKSGWPRWVCMGLLLGASLGCKLTAAGMVVAPVLAWWAWWECGEVQAGGVGGAGGVRGARVGRGVAAVAVAAAVAAAVLAPWAVRNSVATGSPVFPFASSVFGHGWWEPGQIARFAAGHSAPPEASSVAARLHALWDEGVWYGMGAASADGASILPQWNVAWWIAAGAGGLLLARGRGGRRIASAAGVLLLVQVVFWLSATHLKSRFLLPCAVPMGVLVGCAIGQAVQRVLEQAVEVGGMAQLRGLPRFVLSMSVLGMIAWCAGSARFVWVDERSRVVLSALAEAGWDQGMVGGGSKAAADQLLADKQPVPLAWAMNWLLPADAKVASEGEAAVFWCARVPDYGTVWDGGPLARALRAHPGDAASVIAALRAQGFTHLAILDGMLERWQTAGWLDPALTPDAVRAVTSQLRPVLPLAGGGTLYSL